MKENLDFSTYLGVPADKIARNTINVVLALKPWRLRRARDRRLRQVAEEWAKAGGYIIATPQELAAQYPDFFRCSTNEKQDTIMWSISAGLRQPGGYYQPAICPIKNFSR